MRTWADHLISKTYANLIYQVLEINAKPMRCQEISFEISEHSDFPKLSSQYVRRQMTDMVNRGEIIRTEKPIPCSRHKIAYFALPSIVEKKREEEITDFLVEGIAGGVKAFTISEDGKIAKLFDSREK